jgi:hypothetical protein
VDQAELADKAKDLAFNRQGQYRGCFDTDSGHFVLGDLFHICNAGQTTYPPHGTHDSALLAEGRRQVWLHIQAMLNADESDLYRLAQERVRNEREMMNR